MSLCSIRSCFLIISTVVCQPLLMFSYLFPTYSVHKSSFFLIYVLCVLPTSPDVFIFLSFLYYVYCTCLCVFLFISHVFCQPVRVFFFKLSLLCFYRLVPCVLSIISPVFCLPIFAFPYLSPPCSVYQSLCFLIYLPRVLSTSLRVSLVISPVFCLPVFVSTYFLVISPVLSTSPRFFQLSLLGFHHLARCVL
jgi:hypothetical protein